MNKKTKLVIIAEDSSDKTKEKFKYLCNEYNIPIIITGTIEEMSKAIGKDNKAIFAIKDINLANEIKKMYDGGVVIG